VVDPGAPRPLSAHGASNAIARLARAVFGAIIGHRMTLPPALLARYPELADARWRRGGLPVRVGGWCLGRATVAGITLGRTIWLAGQVAIEDASGRSLAADFDGQVREVFARLGRTLEEAGASLADMVTMTVFITDARLGDRFTALRKEIFSDNFPASALITVAGLARPEMLVEVQGVAVAG
jgi:enamine deaminase RidA (YjgF/YER057c/UK114 family)